jgi:hypothetical protein
LKLPEQIREQIRERLWATADDIGWADLPDAERSRYYENWTRDPAIGGKLGHFMDPRIVRVYIKDSLLKAYERHRLLDTGEAVLKRFSIEAASVAESYIKPHGRQLVDGRIVCWGKSRDWKLVLMAAFERAHQIQSGRAYAVVLVETGKTLDDVTRRLVGDAATRLGIEHIEWMM